MTGIDFTGYTHVNLCVDDLEAADDFYGKRLGLEQLPRPDFGAAGTWYRLGNAQLHLVAVEAMPDWNNAAPHLAIHVPTDAFEETVRHIKDAGVELTSDIREREDFGVPVKTAFMKDPAGNLIELTDVPTYS